MASYNLSLSSAQATGTFVQEGHFGSNALHDINISATGEFLPHDGFAAAVDQLDLRHLRYPGGHAENTLDVTRLDNGELRAEVRAFMDWCVANSTPDDKIQVTVVLPTKVDIPAARVEAFVYKLLEDYGDYVSGLEIGNEYSIGERVANADRSIHPEENPDSDFVSSMNETEYGIAANRVINAAQSAIDKLAADRPALGHDPDILIQLGDTNGAGSAYKGNGSWDQANEAILSWLNQTALDAIDGAVAHYYYNKPHTDSLAFDGSYQEIRSLDHRIDNFNAHLGRDVPLFITEWNVLKTNIDQLGMASASTVLEMFEYMVQLDTQEAFIWPLQHRTANTIGGNRSANDLDLSPAGGVFQMMSDTLRPEASTETGHVETFQSMDTTWNGTGGGSVEINYFASQYHDVLYVSYRDLATGTLNVDLSAFTAEATGIDVTRMTMDRSSSDGLSDLADDDGQNRLSRRNIDETEKAALEDLAFFDATNKNHIKSSGDGYLTYLPSPDSIVPLTNSPDSIDDYYFATEVDVAPQFIDLPGDHLGNGSVRLDVMPYDVAQIVIEKKWVQEGGDGGERLTGGIGQDVVLGRSGNDTISTGEGNDTLKGGYGNDVLYGGSGDDSLVAGAGNDTIVAGSGDDLIVAGTGIKFIQGGTGQDTVRLNAASSSFASSFVNGELRLVGDEVDARLEGVEFLEFDDRTISIIDYHNELNNLPNDIFGSANDDFLTGTGNDEKMNGNAGSDVLVGYGGQDTLIGGEGNDLLIAEERGLYGTDASEQVYRLYNAVFGREPDVNGHQFWVSKLASSAMTHAEISQRFMNSPEFRETYGSTTDEEFITLLYQNVLGRTADTGGLISWKNNLAAGMSRERVVQLFAESAEHQMRCTDTQKAFDTGHDPTGWSDDVYRLYRGIFDREPDKDGLAGWVQALSGSTAYQEVVAQFMDSAEFRNSYGTTNDEEFVTLLYANVLTRTPDPGGLEAWMKQLATGMTREFLVESFIQSPEFMMSTTDDLRTYMRGIGGDDTLEAGVGDDILSGGMWSDTFVFNPTGAGTKTVTDLEPWDVVDLRNFGYADVAEAMTHVTFVDGETVFEDQGVCVIFSQAELHAEMVLV